MISFKSHIHESLSSTYPIESAYPNPIRKGVSYRFNFTGNGNLYEATFALNDAETYMQIAFRGKNSLKIQGDRSGSNALKVYGTIANELKKFVSVNPQLETIAFTASDDRTYDLYGTFIHKIAKQLGWKVMRDRGGYVAVKP